MTNVGYNPDSGDIINLHPSPWAEVEKPHGPVGKEMKSHHYALVLSPRVFNVGTEMALVCPITRQMKSPIDDKPSPYELALPSDRGRKVYGVAIISRVTACDWLERNAEYLESVPPDVVKRALSALVSIFVPLI